MRGHLLSKCVNPPFGPVKKIANIRQTDDVQKTEKQKSELKINVALIKKEIELQFQKARLKWT